MLSTSILRGCIRFGRWSGLGKGRHSASRNLLEAVTEQRHGDSVSMAMLGQLIESLFFNPPHAHDHLIDQPACHVLQELVVSAEHCVAANASAERPRSV